MDNAVVTLDVLHSGVIWGWFVTMNFWAKSIATGVVLLAPWMIRHPGMRLRIAVIAFIFLNITLLFTVLDLHQPLRFWHMFVYPQFRSVINLGAWVLTLYNVLLVVHIYLAHTKRDVEYDKLLYVTYPIAFLGTVYTAGLLGQANARETWHAATEAPQMLLAATLAGSAVFLILRSGSDEAAPWLTKVLGGSAAIALAIYLFEIYMAPQKSNEAGHVIHLLVDGELRSLFVGGLLLAFMVPLLVTLFTLRRPTPSTGVIASVSALVGLWMVKHAWLIAPQLVPLS